MKKTLLIALIAVASSSCTTSKPVRVPVCPPSFKAYSAAQQKAAADALRAARSAVLSAFMTDYGRVRAELRAGGCKES